MRVEDVERFGRALAERLVSRTLARLPVSPTAVTLVGTILNVAVACLLALGYLPWAAGLMLFAAAFDALDGALARVTGRQSDLGAYLDATLDRYSETLVGLGLLLYLIAQRAWFDLILLYVFTAGSLLFSYARARAEAEGFQARVGLFTRPLRVLVLAVGLLAGQVRIALWILAVGVQVSAVHRLLAVCLEAQGEALPPLVLLWREWFRERRSRRGSRRRSDDRSRG